jgi:6-phosphogluconolactonase
LTPSFRLSYTISVTLRATRTFATACALAVSLLSATQGHGQEEAAPAPRADKEELNPTFVYVGTNTSEKSKGIHLFRLKTKGLDVSQNITLVPLGLAVETIHPTFLEIDVRRRVVFAVNEVDVFADRPTGSVSAFKVDPATGQLTLLNQQSSVGKAPGHLTLDKEGRNLLVSNSTGLVAVLPVAADGTLGAATSVEGGGSHGVGVALDPADRFAFLCDRGLDAILVFRFDAGKGKLTPHKPASVALKTGAGPRHLVFRPDARFAYVVNALDSTITAFAYDADAGVLKDLETVSTVPEHFDGENTAAEIGIHPSGKYLYVSNRGHNSVVLFRIDPERGTLTYVEEQSTGGRGPLHFGIEPSAVHLAIANQESDTVLVARIDPGNGRLKPSGVFATAPSPTCVKFLPPPEIAPSK